MSLEVEFPRVLYRTSVIIITKGLPYSGKSLMAKAIGEWAKCPVLYIDNFLDTLSMARGNKISEEAEVEVHQLAVDALYKEAKRQLDFQCVGGIIDRVHCVVIKSRLCSTFEFEKLIQLAKDHLVSINELMSVYVSIVIIDCEIRNSHRWRMRMETVIEKGLRKSEEWYKAKNWVDIEMAMDHTKFLDAQFNLNDYLLSSIESFSRSSTKRRYIRVSRLVLDPFDDLNSDPCSFSLELPPTFRASITYLLGWKMRRGSRTWFEQKWNYKDNPNFAVLHFVELQRYLLEKELRTSINRTRTESLCVTTNRSCVFKLSSGSSESGRCRACDLDISTTEYYYTCHFCNLTIHKSCAEMFRPDSSDFISSTLWLSRSYSKTKIACKSCKEFSLNCKSCIFETLLPKDSNYPIIVNHECHPEHALSIDMKFWDKYRSYCKACGLPFNEYTFGYGCYICQFYTHPECALLLPTQVENHEHGGHKHTIKLMYSHHGMKDEHDQSYWCDVCYKDIDPQLWFYTCQSCPYYVAHQRCSLPHYNHIFPKTVNYGLAL